jgi:hypothetical protein
MEIRIAFKILAKELSVMHASSITASHGKRIKMKDNQFCASELAQKARGGEEGMGEGRGRGALRKCTGKMSISESHQKCNASDEFSISGLCRT